MQVLRAWIGLCIFFSWGLSDNWSAEPEVRFNLLTLPSSRQAELRLALPARLNYERAPLRLCMVQLAEQFQFSYWIDRRIDVDKPITLTVPSGTLRECLTKLAQACDAEVGLVENVVTIARAEHLASMQYAAVRLHNQLAFTQAADTPSDSSQPTRKINAELKPLAWPMLTTPAELAEQINSTWKLTIAPSLPHDLLDAGRLQPCTAATQLTLLYSGFDKCAAGKRLSELKLLDMPRAGNWQATYPAGMVTTEQATSVGSQSPEARLEKSGNTWTLIGPTSAHLQLIQPSSKSTSVPDHGPRPPRSPNASTSSDPLGQQRFDISRQNDKPLGAILKNLGEQLGVTIQWDKSLPPSAEHRLVTIEAKKLKLDEILADLARQAKLSITRDGLTVTVSAM